MSVFTQLECPRGSQAVKNRPGGDLHLVQLKIQRSLGYYWPLMEKNIILWCIDLDKYILSPMLKGQYNDKRDF